MEPNEFIGDDELKALMEREYVRLSNLTNEELIRSCDGSGTPIVRVLRERLLAKLPKIK